MKSQFSKTIAGCLFGFFSFSVYANEFQVSCAQPEFVFADGNSSDNLTDLLGSVFFDIQGFVNSEKASFNFGSYLLDDPETEKMEFSLPCLINPSNSNLDCATEFSKPIGVYFTKNEYDGMLLQMYFEEIEIVSFEENAPAIKVYNGHMNWICKLSEL